METASAAFFEGLRPYQWEFDFHIVSVTRDSGDLNQHQSGYHYHFIGNPNKEWLRPRLPIKMLKTYWLLRKLKPNLIHCQDNMILAMASILSGFPRIFTIHGVRRHEAAHRTGWERASTTFDIIIERAAHRYFDAYICISPYAKEILNGKHKTYQIPNPVKSLFFDAGKRRAIPFSPTLVFVGVIAPLKRPEDLIRAHAELRSRFPLLRTIICGGVEDRIYAERINKMISDRNIQGIEFKGIIPQDHLAEIFSRATALVLPSVQENSPMVIAEAMAAGLPVVASRVGGVESLVGHDATGFLYDPGVVPALIRCLDLLLSDPSLVDRLGREAGKKALDHYSPSIIADQTVGAYREILNSHIPNCR